MKNVLIGIVVAALLVLTGAPVRGEAALVAQHVIEPGACKEYTHPSDIVLSNGFWAQAGSDVTVMITPPTEGLLGAIDVVTYCERTQGPDRTVKFPTEGLHYSGSLDAELGVLERPVLVEVGTNVTLPNSVKFYAVTGIGVMEGKNNPCQITLYGRLIDPRFRTGDRKLGEFALDTCRPGIPDWTALDFRKAEFDGPDNRFIRGLRVCMGGKDPIEPLGTGFDNNEIKGLRIRPAAALENGAVEPRDDVKEVDASPLPGQGHTGF